MKRPDRKLNRLPEYNYEQPGGYFVTLCTQNRSRLFIMERFTESNVCVLSDPTRTTNGMTHRSFPAPANQVIHKWVRETKRKFPNTTIEKYVIMPDHLHLIITINEQRAGCSLPVVMQFFKTMTTNEYIRGVKAGELIGFDGKLWQKSYYDHVIRNQQDYDEIWAYIENNPAKWRMIHDIAP